MLQQADHRHSNTESQSRHERARDAKLHGTRRPFREIWGELHQGIQDYFDGLIYEPAPAGETPPLLPDGWTIETGQGDDDDLRLRSIFERWAA